MSSPHSTQPDSDWTSRALARVAEDWAMMIDHEVSIENVQVERESSAPACEGSVHIAFQFGLTHAELGPRYRGALLVPLPDALTMAAYLMMTPENQIAGARAAQAPDSATKDSLMELSSILASALDGVVQDSFEGTWSVTSLGCQGVREGAVPRVSTADDLAIYAATLLGGGKRGEESILSPESVNNMTRGRRIADGNRRALGWDSQSRYSSNRGDLLSRRAFGHGGFTGTAMWIDPELELFVIFLSNRLHPDGEGSINRLAGRVATIAAASIQDVSASPLPSRESSSVLCGIDVLKRDGFAPLAGKRVGLITNHTGLDLDGRSAVELLHEAPEVDLRVLFSPEHGFAGKLDQSIIGNEQDAETGLEIVSLYGESRTPPAESLTDLDALVFDIQDIGARFYTYISTMQNSMRAAAEHGASFYVLDRPNPIGGLEVAGPVLDEGLESFVGPHRIAVRHGMTVGELALMFREELEIDVDLHVIRVEGWQRDEYYDATGLTWVNPSPNMRNLHQAVLYPGIGLLETTNLSVGRGTDTPFELFGAPWIQPRELARELNERGLPGVRFVPVCFTPDSSKFKDEECGGVNLIVTERARLRPVRTGIEIAAVLRQLYPDDWETERLNRLLCDQQVFESIVAGESPDSIEAGYGPELRDFRRRRNGFLLY